MDDLAVALDAVFFVGLFVGYLVGGVTLLLVMLWRDRRAP